MAVKATLRTAKSPTSQPSVTSAPAQAGTGAVVEATVVAPKENLESLVPGEAAPEGAPTPPESAVATRPYTSRQNLVGDGIEGDWGDDDIKLPQFKIVQGSGPLSQVFQNGEIIFADETLLPPPSIKPDAKNTPIRFVPISLKRQWVEKLTEEQNDAGMVPRIAYSLDEVYANGGTTQWGRDGQPDNFWQDAARCIILLELPEGSQHPGFTLDFGGKQYAIAVWYVSGGAYRRSAKVIIGASQSSLLVPVLDEKGQPQKSPSGQVLKRSMIWKNFWTLNFTREPVGPKKFMVWYPTVRIVANDQTSGELRDYIAGIASNQSAQNAAAE